MNNPLDFSGLQLDHIKDDSSLTRRPSFYPEEWETSFKRHPGMYCFNVLYSESMKNPDGRTRNPTLLQIKGELLEIINRFLNSSAHYLSDETMAMVFLAGVYELLCDDCERAKVYFTAQRAIIAQRGGLQALSCPRTRRVKLWGDQFFWYMMGEKGEQHFARPYRQSSLLVDPAHPIRVALRSCNRALHRVHQIHEAFFSIHAPEQHLIGALVRLAKLANSVPARSEMQAPYVKAEVAGLRALLTNGKFTKVVSGFQEYADLVIGSIRHAALLILGAIDASLESGVAEAEDRQPEARPIDSLDINRLASDPSILMWVSFAAGAWAEEQVRRRYVALVDQARRSLQHETWDGVQESLSGILFCKFLMEPYHKLWEECTAVVKVA